MYLFFLIARPLIVVTIIFFFQSPCKEGVTGEAKRYTDIFYSVGEPETTRKETGDSKGRNFNATKGEKESCCDNNDIS